MIHLGCIFGGPDGPAAIAAAEPFRVERDVRSESEIRVAKVVEWKVRGLERLDSGTAYPVVADVVADRVDLVRKAAIEHAERLIETEYRRTMRKVREQIRKRARERPTLYVDVTDTGETVVKLLRDRLRGRDGMRARLVEVQFVSGAKWNRERWDKIRVGRDHVITVLRTLLQSKRVSIPPGAKAEMLREEFLSYRSAPGTESNRYRSRRSPAAAGSLVAALGLCVQDEPVGRSLRVVKFG